MSEELDNTQVEEQEQPKEAWLESGDVPVSTHIHMKSKLKGRLSDANAENEDLKQRLAALEQKQEPQQRSRALARPLRSDYEDMDTYYSAMDTYLDDKAADHAARIDAQRKGADVQRNLSSSVDQHYARAAEAMDKAGVKPEIFQAADRAVRSAVESMFPGKGDTVTDQLISNLGDGSERVMYFLGHNQQALDKFRAKLQSDPSGISAAVYLGTQKNKLTKPARAESAAPAPAPNLSGGTAAPATGMSEAQLHKKYTAAHKKDDVAAAFSFKRAARAAGADTSGW